ncbi:YheC/YheD family protein [Desulfuribacillus alkaliarsenatis]|uniref:ATP-grasp domain-containing protein n=1 Tax=Desulfuribacillus alkaliarsenatis TaxID=766136 RepID=A0A1E5G2Y7_9FIRM|nr:YheC/YheD family protein [Desulfuribacillus alkaliarsenatis]OEF97401.1 hypothetical protein BHF68_04115 [Desulfuribacillus alkaliarsenatis]
MKKKNRILGIVVKSLTGKSAYKEYFRNSNNLNLEIILFRPKDINWKTQKIKAEIYNISSGNWQKKNSAFPTVIYNRYYASNTKAINRLVKAIGENKLYNRLTKLNKLETYKALQGTSVEEYLPSTAQYSQQELIKLLESEGQIILKSTNGTLGNNIYWVQKHMHDEYSIYKENMYEKKSYSDELSFIDKISELTSAEEYILQSYIPLVQIDERRVDFRIMVQKNISGKWETTASLARMTFKDSFITNSIKKVDSIENVLTELGLSSERIKEIIEKIEKISIQAATELDSRIGHCAELGIDIAFDQVGQIWLIEANGRPSKGMFKKLKDKSIINTIYRKPLEYASFLMAK